MTRSDTYGTAARTDTGGPTTAPETGYGSQAGTATGYGSQADTATEGPGMTGDSPAATGLIPLRLGPREGMRPTPRMPGSGRVRRPRG